MNIYLTEEEQIKKIKDWLKEYGLAVILGIAVFFMLSFGWRYWQQYKNNHAAQASIVYEQLITAHIAGNYDDVKLYAKHLRDDYARTPYASLGSLVAARDATVSKDLSGAEQDLQWVVDKTSNKGIKQVARIRLSRVLLEDKQPQKALDAVAKIDDNTYLPMIYATKGDIYLSTGDKNLAMQEYKNADEVAADDSFIKAIIEMKINQLLK